MWKSGTLVGNNNVTSQYSERAFARWMEYVKNEKYTTQNYCDIGYMEVESKIRIKIGTKIGIK